MKAKPVIPRLLAHQDIEEAVDHYCREGAEKAALGFINAIERAFLQLGRHPATGSFRFAHALDLPGLRTWPLARYRHLVFYVDQPDHVDVWRVLHGQRDLPALLLEPVNPAAGAAWSAEPT